MSDLHGRDHLPALLAELSEARAREWREQHQIGSRPELLRAARLETLLALDAYAAAIEALHWPVPRGIPLDIELRRALLGPGGR